MLSLELVSEIQEGASVVTPFQPWWEILIDYSLTGFLLTVILGLAGVTFTGVSEIACIPIENGTETTDLSTSVFVNSRCSRKFDGRFLLYYPYLALLAYLVLLFGHLLSVKLPSTSSFLNVIFQLFNDFKTLGNSSSYFGGAAATGPEEMRKGGKQYKVLRLEVKEQVIAMIERLISILRSSSGFFVVYVAKSIILFIGSAVVIGGNISTLVLFDWSLVFQCDLTTLVPTLYEVTTCTIPAAPFLYGMMVVSSGFAFYIFIFTLRAVAWLVQTRNFQSDYLKSWGKGSHILRDLPGFRDFCFCLMLMKNNGTDGEGVYETVNSSLKIYTSLKIEEHFENDQLLGTTVASDVQFEKGNYICNFMLQEMGMESKETSKARDLVIALTMVCESLGMDVDEKDNCKKLREMIFNELVSHPTRYKDMIDNSPQNLSSFREYLKSIKDGSLMTGEVFECHYVLMAFANCARVKVVLLRPHRSSFVFTPLEDNDEPLKVIFLKHVPPNDYSSVTPLEDASPQQSSDRDQFLVNSEYSENLHNRALDSWRSTGYPNYLKTLSSILPKYLTGTDEVLDREDGFSSTHPVKNHLAYLEDLGLGENEENEEDKENNLHCQA